MADTTKIVNPYCIVNLYYWEVNGKQLDCRRCILDCPNRYATTIKD